MTTPSLGTCVVIGAGVAGALTAATLAESAEEVILIERDRLTTTAGPRPGIPQSRFPHLLLPAGVRGLEALMPGVVDEMIASGAMRTRIPADVRILTPTGWLPQVVTDLWALACSRPLIDHHIRARAVREQRVTILDHTSVTGVVITGGRVRGVTVKSAAGAEELHIPAAVVVDASGRRSATTAWLGAAGYSGPPAREVDAGVSYSARIYRSGPVRRQVVCVQAAPPETMTFGIVVPVENGEHQVGIGAMRPRTAPRTVEEFDHDLLGLRDQAIAEALPGTAAAQVRTFHPGASRWNRFDRWRRWPAGLVVLGDALCTLNPVYGQGMSVAVLQVMTLHKALHGESRTAGTLHRLRRDLSRTVKPAWILSSSEDQRFPGTRCRSSLSTKLMHRSIDHLLERAMTDHRLAGQLSEVLALTKPPKALLRPSVAVAALARPGARP
ncbi:NAD(P)/FAD-dependent oxidoreductase [Amycolatopsis japonica]